MCAVLLLLVLVVVLVLVLYSSSASSTAEQSCWVQSILDGINCLSPKYIYVGFE